MPVGRYAQESLTKLGLWATVEPKLAMTDNVRAALEFVARGEAALGIVYATDAAAEPRVKVVATLPDDSHKPIVYPLAIVAASNNPDAARFVAFLRSERRRRAVRGPGIRNHQIDRRPVMARSRLRLPPRQRQLLARQRLERVVGIGGRRGEVGFARGLMVHREITLRHFRRSRHPAARSR